MNFYTLFDTSLDGVFVVTQEGQFVYCNEVFANLFATTVRRILTKNIFSIISPGAPFLDPLLAISRGQDVTPYLETDFTRTDGETLKVQISAQKSDGNILVFVRNVHLEATLFEKYRRELGQKEGLIKQLARKVFELEFLLSSTPMNLGDSDVHIMRKMVFKKVHENLDVALIAAFKVIETGAIEKYVEIEDHYESINSTPEILHQRLETDIKKWRTANLSSKFAEKSYILEHEGEFFVVSCAARTKSLDWHIYSYYFKNKEKSTENLILLDSLTKQTTLNIENQGLFIQSITDEKTQLYNQRYLKYRFSQEIQRASRHGSKFALLVFDIDHFKKLNDTYGHLAGDQVLIGVAQTIKNFFRVTDIAARFGGEEFVVLCLDTNLDGVVDLANRIRERISNKDFPVGNGAPLRTSVSIGVAFFPQHGKDADALFKSADEALYKAKANGRNRVELAELQN